MGFVLLLASPSSAAAQCRLCDKPTTEMPVETNVGALEVRVETRLDFDSVIVMGAGDGSATLRPDGTRMATGTLSDVGGRAMVGTVSVRGMPNRSVRVELPRMVVLHSVSGGEIRVEQIASDLPSLARLDAAGNLTFHFGGRLELKGDADGGYRGELPITVDYL